MTKLKNVRRKQWLRYLRRLTPLCLKTGPGYVALPPAMFGFGEYKKTTIKSMNRVRYAHRDDEIWWDL
jgi:hypothetical protein